jgi:chromate reductase
MITVISCTNRINSSSLKLARHCSQLMEKQGVNHKLFSFEQLPVDIAFNEVFSKRSEKFQQILNDFIIPAEKFLLIVPEYNGSFPGILKVFLDAIHPEVNRGKKTALIGVSSGRAGNVRGMEDLTGILNYLGMHVYPVKLPVSSILTLMDAEGNIKDENTLKVIEKQVELFINY